MDFTDTEKCLIKRELGISGWNTSRSRLWY